MNTDFIQIRRLVLDLSAAATAKRFDLAFTHMRVAAATDGSTSVDITFNDRSNDPVTFKSGRRALNWPSEKIWLSWSAQAGKSITLEFWGGPTIGPPELVDDATVATIDAAVQVSSIVAPPTVASITAPVTLVAPDCGPSSYYLAGSSNVLKTIITPAANINGVRITQCSVGSYSQFVRLMAKASAPTSADDTAAMTLAFYSGNTSVSQVSTQIALPVVIPAGLGIYSQCAQATYFNRVALAYEVL